MRRLLSLVAMLLIVLAASVPLAADKAHSNYNKGVDAEKRQDYERAFDISKRLSARSPRRFDIARRTNRPSSWPRRRTCIVGNCYGMGANWKKLLLNFRKLRPSILPALLRSRNYGGRRTC